ncbi:LysE family translocator [Vreelandella sp. EE27]
MSLHVWLTFFIAYLLITLSPGPNVLLVIRNTLRYGATGTVIALTGNLLAQLFTILLVALGVGTLLSTLPTAFTVLKVIGAAYLVYLGVAQLVTSFKTPAAAQQVVGSTPSRHRSLLLEAFLVSISNPKTLLFLSAFLPQFLDHTVDVTRQFALMYLTIALIVIGVHSSYALAVRRLGHHFQSPRWKAAFSRISGTLFIGMGLRLAGSRT